MEDIAYPHRFDRRFSVALPWLILHYVTKWKQAPKITHEDEQLLDELHLLARRLEDRVNTVERIVAADNPNFKPGLQSEWRPETAPRPDRLQPRSEELR